MNRRAFMGTMFGATVAIPRILWNYEPLWRTIKVKAKYFISATFTDVGDYFTKIESAE